MYKNFTSGILVAGLLASASISVSAQAPQSAPAQAPSQARPAAPADMPPMPAKADAPAPQASDLLKVTGCLKNEKDVAGLTPNVAERAGITEDYILTEVTLSPDSQVSGIGLGAMYEIEGIKESELKAHLNHRIEVTGRLSKVETGAAAANASNRGDVPDFHATSVKMLAATCAAK